MRNLVLFVFLALCGLNMIAQEDTETTEAKTKKEKKVKKLLMLALSLR